MERAAVRTVLTGAVKDTDDRLDDFMEKLEVRVQRGVSRAFKKD